MACALIAVCRVFTSTLIQSKLYIATLGTVDTTLNGRMIKRIKYCLLLNNDCRYIEWM